MTLNQVYGRHQESCRGPTKCRMNHVNSQKTSIVEVHGRQCLRLPSTRMMMMVVSPVEILRCLLSLKVLQGASLCRFMLAGSIRLVFFSIKS